MARFFFHIRDDSRLVEDGRGLDLPNLASALAEARRAALEIRARFPGSSGALQNKEFEICDDAGRELAVLALCEAPAAQRRRSVDRALAGLQTEWPAQIAIRSLFAKSGPAANTSN
jgi:hypothetical protein